MVLGAPQGPIAPPAPRCSARLPHPYRRRPRRRPRRLWTRRSSCPGTAAPRLGPAPGHGSGRPAAGPGLLPWPPAGPAGPAGQSPAGDGAARAPGCSGGAGLCVVCYLPVGAALGGVADLVIQLLRQLLQGRQPPQAQLALCHRRLHQLRGLREHCRDGGPVTGTLPRHPVPSIRARAGAVSELGLTGLVQPEGLLEVAEPGQHVGPGDVHQDGDGAVIAGLEGTGVGSLHPHAGLLAPLPRIFPAR